MLRFAFFVALGVFMPSAESAESSQVASRTPAELIALIDEAGAARPDWWSGVALDYPESLDLSWPEPQGPWDTRKNVGQYIWSVINENPGRWKQGTKFLHYVLIANKDRPMARRKAIEQLAHCYHDLLEDWARAAYWLRRLDSRNIHQVISLAHSYWELGCRELAVEELSKVTRDPTRYGSAIKLWSDMGDLDKALELADTTAKVFRADGAWMGAGDACRRHGRPELAIEYYKKVLEIPIPKEDGILERNHERARRALRDVRLFESLDLARIPDGTYQGTSLSYNGDLTVAVGVRAGRIETVGISSHSDKQYYSALEDTPRQIVDKQRLGGIDATTGATITSEAVVHASAAALSAGQGLEPGAP